MKMKRVHRIIILGLQAARPTDLWKNAKFCSVFWWNNANLQNKDISLTLNSFCDFATLFDATQIFMDPLLYFMSRNM